MHGLAEFYIEGGFTMFITLFVGFVGFGISIDRAWRFWGDYSMDAKAFMKKVRALLVEDRVDDALRLCANQKKGLVPSIVKAAVERYGCDESLVKQNVEAAYLTVTPLFSVCEKHGYLRGEHEYCPFCDEELLHIHRHE